MGSGFAAGAGADMLQEILKRKFQEVIARQEMQQRQQALTDQNTRFYSGQEHQSAENQKGREFTHGENEAGRTFTAGQNDLGRNFTANQNEAGRVFTGQQGNLNRQNALTLEGLRGRNALAVASQNHPGVTPDQQNEVQDTLNLIDQISSDKSLPNATGPIDSRGYGMATDTVGVTRVNSLYNQLVGKMSLAQAGKLKGQGQISDKERALLRDAATALNTHLGDADFVNELAKVRSQFERMQGGGVGAPTLPEATGGLPAMPGQNIGIPRAPDSAPAQGVPERPQAANGGGKVVSLAKVLEYASVNHLTREQAVAEAKSKGWTIN